MRTVGRDGRKTVAEPKNFVHYSRLENPTYADNTECCGIPTGGLNMTNDFDAVTCPHMSEAVRLSRASQKILYAAMLMIEKRIWDGVATSREIYTFLANGGVMPPIKEEVRESAREHFIRTKHTITSQIKEPGWRCVDCEARSPAWDMADQVIPPNQMRAEHNLPPARPDWDDYFLGIAKAVAARADCTRRQVGAVVVNWRQQVISTGYNGAEPGGPSCLKGECPRGTKSTDEVAPGSSYDTGTGACVAIHAEQNALLYSDYTARVGGIIYITCPPCDGCLRMLKGSGLKKAVFYSESGHRDEITLQPEGYIK